MRGDPFTKTLMRKSGEVGGDEDYLSDLLNPGSNGLALSKDQNRLYVC